MMGLDKEPWCLTACTICSGDHTVKVSECSTGRNVQVLDGHVRTPWVVSQALQHMPSCPHAWLLLQYVFSNLMLQEAAHAVHVL